MDLPKRIVETFRQMAETEEEAECYELTVIYSGEETEYMFTAEELNNMTDDAMEMYIRSLIERNYH